MEKTIEELEKELEKIKTKIEKLKQKEQTEWVPKINQLYYWVDLDSMEVNFYNWDNENVDNVRLKHKVVFRYEQEAKEWLKYLLEKEKIMNEFSQEEWEDENISKYCINYKHDDKSLGIDINWAHQKLDVLYFRSQFDAQAFINKYEKCIKRDMGICENQIEYMNKTNCSIKTT